MSEEKKSWIIVFIFCTFFVFAVYLFEKWTQKQEKLERIKELESGYQLYLAPSGADNK